MGQFLCIGIYTQIRASRKDAEYQYHSVDECCEHIIKDKELDEALYDFSEDDEDIYYTLKPEILWRDVAALTKRFYAMRYRPGHEYDSDLIGQMPKLSRGDGFSASKKFPMFPRGIYIRLCNRNSYFRRDAYLCQVHHSEYGWKDYNGVLWRVVPFPHSLDSGKVKRHPFG